MEMPWRESFRGKTHKKAAANVAAAVFRHTSDPAGNRLERLFEVTRPALWDGGESNHPSNGVAGERGGTDGSGFMAEGGGEHHQVVFEWTG